MNKVLVIGATGQVGQMVVDRLASKGIAVRAMVRDSDKAKFSSNVEVVEADIEGDFSHVLNGCSHVIFTAGSGAGTGFDKTLLVDLWGARKAIDFALGARIDQFIMVSSRGADNPDKGPERIKPYLVAKHFADEYLKASGLPYTILQPGRLLDAHGTGYVRTDRPEAPEAQIISRDDTANAVIHCLGNTGTFNKVYELFIGDHAIDELLI